ncbi:MAG: hypothetical protein JNL93_21645 [Pelomonas sp.]|nr:hypothetical protein [Roseateles sp.]
MQATAAREKYAKAKALFEERCKSAGVVIKRTVKDVEGIELIKIRQPIPWGGKEYFDPMYSEAAMAAEMRGDYYVKQFLMSELRFIDGVQSRGGLAPPSRELDKGMEPPRRGYRFVEILTPNSSERSRCELVLKPGEDRWENTALSCRPVVSSSAQYALDYDDIVDPADRALWVAGTRIKVVDKRTGEVVAQLTRYVWESGFGEASSGSWPWQHANHRVTQTCPGVPDRLFSTESRYFVDTVLIPKQGD